MHYFFSTNNDKKYYTNSSGSKTPFLLLQKDVFLMESTFERRTVDYCSQENWNSERPRLDWNLPRLVFHL
jgi:hypothetical protein